VLQEQRELISTANAGRTGGTGQDLGPQHPGPVDLDQDDQASPRAKMVHKKVCEENRLLLVQEAGRRSAKDRVRAGPGGTRRSARIQGRAPEYGEVAAVIPTPEQRGATDRKKAKRVQASEDARQARAAAAVVALNATCSVCHSMHDPETILLCDTRGCKRGRHLKCCNPPLTRVPRGFWFCGCVVEALLAPAPEQQQQALPHEGNPEQQPGAELPHGDEVEPEVADRREGLQDNRPTAPSREQRQATRLHTTRISAVAHEELDRDGYNAAERQAADEDLERSLQGGDLDTVVQIAQTPGGSNEAALSQNAACWRMWIRREELRERVRREQETLAPAAAPLEAHPAPASSQVMGGPVSATLGENLLRMQQEPSMEEDPEWSQPTTTLW
jgi:hypothetical protein